MLVINPRDARPIYVQIKEGLCRLILSGAMATGERYIRHDTYALASAIMEVYRRSRPTR